MRDGDETSQSTVDGTTVWLVLDMSQPGHSVSAFWQRVDAATHATALSAANPLRHVVLTEVTVHGGRRQCRLCGAPVVLDDPFDVESWRHADDANDLGDHTAEA